MRFVVVFVALAACRHSPAVAPREAARTPKPMTAMVQPLTPDVVLERISTSYLGGMKRCYRARLKHDARARGHVIVTFTVDERGRLASREAKGVDLRAGRAVEACVERAMARWSFPAPADQTTFRLTFQLSSRS